MSAPGLAILVPHRCFVLLTGLVLGAVRGIGKLCAGQGQLCAQLSCQGQQQLLRISYHTVLVIGRQLQTPQTRSMQSRSCEAVQAGHHKQCTNHCQRMQAAPLTEHKTQEIR